MTGGRDDRRSVAARRRGRHWAAVVLTTTAMLAVATVAIVATRDDRALARRSGDRAAATSTATTTVGTTTGVTARTTTIAASKRPHTTTPTTVPSYGLPDVGRQPTWAPAAAYADLPSPLPLANRRPLVAVFGDSLVVQALTYAHEIAQRRGYRMEGGAFGGLALCDEVASIQRTLREQRPAVVVLGFAGNAITPCMGDTNTRGAAAIAARYAADARTVIAAADGVGADVWFVAGPWMRDPRQNAVVGALEAAWHALAARDAHVRVVDSSRMLAPAGYTDRLPCRAYEVALGCRGTQPIRAVDGVHLADADARGYSSGAFRYAEALTGHLPPR